MRSCSCGLVLPESRVPIAASRYWSYPGPVRSAPHPHHYHHLPLFRCGGNGLRSVPFRDATRPPFSVSISISVVGVTCPVSYPFPPRGGACFVLVVSSVPLAILLRSSFRASFLERCPLYPVCTLHSAPCILSVPCTLCPFCLVSGTPPNTFCNLSSTCQPACASFGDGVGDEQ